MFRIGQALGLVGKAWFGVMIGSLLFITAPGLLPDRAAAAGVTWYTPPLYGLLTGVVLGQLLRLRYVCYIKGQLLGIDVMETMFVAVAFLGLLPMCSVTFVWLSDIVLRDHDHLIDLARAWFLFLTSGVLAIWVTDLLARQWGRT